MSAVVAVVGLGYVGLPLAVAFGKRGRTSDFAAKVAPGGCVLDIKGALDLEALRRAGCTCWRL